VPGYWVTLSAVLRSLKGFSHVASSKFMKVYDRTVLLSQVTRSNKLMVYGLIV